MSALIKGPTIKLSSGRYFSFENPEPLTIKEIAHALSNICRFTGHCREFYSVAQHAVLVSRLIEPEFAWEGFHHDDGESVVGDMASPLKRLLPGYKAIERRCELPILAAFGIDADNMPPQVKVADLKALRTEQRDVMSGDGELWSDLSGIEPACERIFPVAPHIAEQMFLDRYWELSKRRDQRPQAAT